MKKMLTQNFLVTLFLTAIFTTSVNAMPERVVTLSPNLAEWVGEMLGKENTFKHLVGVSEYSQYPDFIKEIEKIGPYPHISIEKVLKLKPTLVIALSGSNDEEQLRQLERLKIKVVRMPQENFFDMQKWLKNLGAILGESDKARLAINKWNELLQKINSKMARVKQKSKKTFIEIQDEPLVTIGGTSFLSDAFKSIGYQNVFSNLTQSYPKVSRESVLSLNPAYIYILDLEGNAQGFEGARNRWRKFSNLEAAKLDQVKFLKGDDYGRCSLRLLIALEKLI